VTMMRVILGGIGGVLAVGSIIPGSLRCYSQLGIFVGCFLAAHDYDGGTVVSIFLGNLDDSYFLSFYLRFPS